MHFSELYYAVKFNKNVHSLFTLLGNQATLFAQAHLCRETLVEELFIQNYRMSCHGKV